MKLKKIILNNIRSYTHQELNFPQGSVLLSGDIGAGKTSVLLGIEFALFGLQPGQRGSALLKNGEIEGGVKIEFEVDDKEIVIERTLKKGKTISQDYCAITIDGIKKETSVTELKNQVLEILSYPKEFSKKQNLLYKFTVYTPQEEMKQIILQDAETRINTLRHVFGIDKYKKVLENVTVVAVKIREEKRLKQGLTANLEQEKESLSLKEKELEIRKQNLISAESEFLLKTEQRKKVEEEKQEIFKKIDEKGKVNQEIEKTKIMVSTKKDSINENKKVIERIGEQIQELSELRFDENKIVEAEKEIEEMKKQKNELNQKNLEIVSKISALDLKNKENAIIKEKISHIEVCPTCLQDVDADYKKNVLNKLDTSTSESDSKINSLNFERKDIVEKIASIDEKISLKEKVIQEFNILKIKLQGIEEKEKQLAEIGKSNELLNKDVELLTKHLEALQKSFFELGKFEGIFETKQKEFEELLNQEKLAEIKTAELKKEIEVFSTQIQELKNKIARTKEIESELHYLTELENWLSKKFVPLISFIEKNVMIKLKAEFSQLFAEWFAMLVSESFNVYLRDDFTPVIEQQDYEIDYSYLSGGERTAVALAYRLSLNQVINSLLSKIKTRNLVILDEPTDGFSEQQLDKMRDVLQELSAEQLIIVSHEQKIEGFVDNVMKFKKEQGISKVVS